MSTELQDVTDTAVSLSVVEIGLGSLLHAFKIPFRGHILAINQGLFLQNLSQKQLDRKVAARCIFEASVVTAILKSMFPSTNSLGPMISIVMQGCLYALGILVGGRNRIGSILSMSFLCVWGFFQPFITYGLIFGMTFLINTADLIKKFCLKVGFEGQNLWVLVLILLGFKIMLGLVLQYWFVDFKKQITEKALDSARFLQRRKTKSFHKSTLMKVFYDLTTPLFLLTWILTVCCIFLSQSTSVDFLWLALRPLTVGFITFYLLRSSWPLVIFKKIFQKSQFGQRIGDTAAKSLTILEEWIIHPTIK
ncbi:MAG: hypothetical protein ACRYGR_05200 [Janthinobacterium lividum]